MSSDKRTIYVGGLADDVNEKLINDAFIPFGDIADIQMPVDYESQRHRGFAFIEYETAEDAAAAIDNMVSILDHIITWTLILSKHNLKKCLERC